jgi:hypothetical protein
LERIEVIRHPIKKEVRVVNNLDLIDMDSECSGFRGDLLPIAPGDNIAGGWATTGHGRPVGSTVGMGDDRTVSRGERDA